MQAVHADRIIAPDLPFDLIDSSLLSVLPSCPPRILVLLYSSSFILLIFIISLSTPFSSKSTTVILFPLTYFFLRTFPASPSLYPLITYYLPTSSPFSSSSSTAHFSTSSLSSPFFQSSPCFLFVLHPHSVSTFINGMHFNLPL